MAKHEFSQLCRPAPQTPAFLHVPSLYLFISTRLKGLRAISDLIDKSFIKCPKTSFPYLAVQHCRSDLLIF